MKKIIMATLALVISMGMVLGGCSKNDAKTTTSSGSGSGGGTADNSSAGTDEVKGIDPATVKGKVVVSFPNWGATLEEDMKTEAMDKFNDIYPGVELVYDSWIGTEGLDSYLTVKASAGQLPDVVKGWNSMGFYHTQGWVAPLNEFLETDPDAQYIPKVAKDSFSINDKLYAVPFDVVFNAILVNLDLLETLNEDVPDYDWTIDEFIRLSKKATTDEYSGITSSWNLANILGTSTDPDLWLDQYDPVAQKFNFTNGSWARGIKYVNDLKAVKGLFGDELKNQVLRDAGEVDDYEKKFGKDADALKESKILFHPDGTWEKGGWHKGLPFNWDYFPVPQDADVGFKNPAHFNYIFMTTAVKDENKQAAYEVLKYLGHGSQGTLNRLANAYAAEDPETGSHAVHAVPATLHPDVIAKLKESKTMKPGEMYLYEKMDNCVRGDISKTTVDIGAIINPQLDPIRDDLMTGKISPDAVASDIETKVNAEFEKLYGDVVASAAK